MKETELWEILVSLSANEISLAETHDRILRLEPSEQLVCVHPYEEVYQSESECYCEKCGKDLTESS